MKYKIIVDKQSRTNPSSEKKQYEIDIEELRIKDNIYDSLIVTKDESYVMRRLSLSELNVLSVLENEVKEPLEDLNIELFEGDNYIYLIDMAGNRFYAEYLIKNDFNDIYITKNEMGSVINQTAQQLEFAVTQKLSSYTTTKEMEAFIDIKVNKIKQEVSNTYATQVSLTEERSERIQTATEIKEEVSKKVDDKTITGAYLMLRINNDTSEGKIKADKISITASDVLNILANNEINFTTKNMTLKSTNFSVDKNGKITAKSGTIGGFTLDATQFSSTINGLYDYNLYDARAVLGMILYDISATTIISSLYDLDANGTINVRDAQEMIKINLGTSTNTKKISGTFQINSSNPKNFISIKNGGNLAVSIGVGGINSHFIGGETAIFSTQSISNSSTSFEGVAIEGKKGKITCVKDNKVLNIAPDKIELNNGYVVSGKDTTHNYSVHWTGSQMQFLVDGQVVKTL